MSSHRTACVMCGDDAWCHDEEHALGLGGGCHDDHALNFCSVECFVALRQAWEQRVVIVRSDPEEWPRVARELEAALSVVHASAAPSVTRDPEHDAP